MDYSLQRPPETRRHCHRPLATERSVVKLTGERADKRLQHWRHVVIAACEQCGRNRALGRAGTNARRLSRGGRGGKRRLLLSPDAATPLKRVPPAAAVVLR
jgi:16S rRNA (uracil1498-N3)-methyltransferase